MRFSLQASSIQVAYFDASTPSIRAILAVWCCSIGRRGSSTPCTGIPTISIRCGVALFLPWLTVHADVRASGGIIATTVNAVGLCIAFC